MMDNIHQNLFACTIWICQGQQASREKSSVGQRSAFVKHAICITIILQKEFISPCPAVFISAVFFTFSYLAETTLPVLLQISSEKGLFYNFYAAQNNHLSYIGCSDPGYDRFCVLIKNPIAPLYVKIRCSDLDTQRNKSSTGYTVHIWQILVALAINTGRRTCLPRILYDRFISFDFLR